MQAENHEPVILKLDLSMQVLLFWLDFNKNLYNHIIIIIVIIIRLILLSIVSWNCTVSLNNFLKVETVLPVCCQLIW